MKQTKETRNRSQVQWKSYKIRLVQVDGTTNSNTMFILFLCYCGLFFPPLAPNAFYGAPQKNTHIECRQPKMKEERKKCKHTANNYTIFYLYLRSLCVCVWVDVFAHGIYKDTSICKILAVACFQSQFLWHCEAHSLYYNCHFRLDFIVAVARAITYPPLCKMGYHWDCSRSLSRSLLSAPKQSRRLQSHIEFS